MNPHLPREIADWPSHARDRFHERAAIIEFDGCIPRDRAERAAEHLTRTQWAQAVEDARRKQLPPHLLP